MRYVALLPRLVRGLYCNLRVSEIHYRTTRALRYLDLLIVSLALTNM